MRIPAVDAVCDVSTSSAVVSPRFESALGARPSITRRLSCTPCSRKPNVIVSSLRPIVAASAITNRSTGNAITISVRRETSVSTQPL